MGDVAMTVPVLKNLLSQYPGLSVTFVSDKKFKSLFADIPRLIFLGADLKGRHKGVNGMYRLFREIRKGSKFGVVADMHDVLRTKLLRFFFRLSGFRIHKIDKSRTDKRKLTRKKNKVLHQLTPVFSRYANVLADAGYPVLLNQENERIRSISKNSDHRAERKIGIAPFAKHREKTYPPEKMEKVIEWLSRNQYKIYLFGGGATEEEMLEEWEKKYNDVTNAAGKYSLAEELKLIQDLDLMISMDSANMHLASLYGVPVISIWGATHPFAGFYGYGQDPQNIIQADLYCRPCSVFGNKKCFRGDWACMNMIAPELIIMKIQEFFSK